MSPMHRSDAGPRPDPAAAATSSVASVRRRRRAPGATSLDAGAAARPARVAAFVLALSCALVALGSLCGGTALAGRTFRNAAFRIEAFDLPRGWQPAAQLGYPKILVVAYGPEGGKLVLGAQRVTPGQTAMDLAAGARAVLVAQGFGDPRVAPEFARAAPARRGHAGEEEPPAERARLDATFDAGRQLLRQWYIVDVDVAVVVTVTTPATKQRALKDAETAVSTLVFAPLGSAVPMVEPQPADAGAPPDGGPP